MDGILNVYKKTGYTSFDVIAILRGILQQKKIGHAGTLDPMAEGVLPVCLGSATKLCEYMTDHDKVYEAVMLLGVTYDTEDTTGKKLTESPVTSTKEEIEEAVKSFIGGYDQTPPMYSAKKVDGKKLYELARQGRQIERKSVHVDIMDIKIISMDLPRVRLEVSCGKGTYIRSLISDIGSKLGCGAAMESLIRKRVGDLEIDSALDLFAIENLVAKEELSQYVEPVESVFKDYEKFYVNDRLLKFLMNGNKFTSEDFEELGSERIALLNNGQRIRVYTPEGDFKAVYEMNTEKKELKPVKMFL